MKRACLKAEKIVHRGVPVYRITGWENVLTGDELPEQYDPSGARFALDSCDQLKIGDGTGCTRTFPSGCIVKPTTFDELLATMKTAGARLTQINKDIKLLEATWVAPEAMYEI